MTMQMIPACCSKCNGVCAELRIWPFVTASMVQLVMAEQQIERSCSAS